MATARKLLGMSNTPPLTKRDAWAATFEHVLSLPTPRKDCPLHLPNARPPSENFAPEKESALPINDLQAHILTVHAHLAGVPNGDISHVRKQGQVAEWTQKYFHRHASNTMKWKRSKTLATYAVVVQPYNEPGKSYHAWDVNQGTRRIAPWDTISLRGLLPSLCLDYSMNSSSPQPPRPGDPVGVSACYPSSAPDTNRDPAQQWLWETDSTVRPAAYRRLCLTTDALEGANGSRGKAFLQLCDGRPEQHW